MPNLHGYRPHARGLLVLGLPLIGSHLAQIAIGVTDASMLGWYDVDALAAATVAHSVWFVFFIVGSGFAYVVLPTVASAIAAGDPTQVRRVTRMGLWLSTLFGAVVMPPLIWSRPLLIALGQEPETAELAEIYMRLLAFSMIPALLVMVLKSYLAALERSQPVLWFTVASAVLNVLVNYALIFGNLGFPEMGIRGAAIASLSVHVFSLLAFCLYVGVVTPEHAVFARLWRPDWEAFGRVFRLGWPIGLTNLAESGLFAASAVMMGWLGALPLAAHGIAIQLAAMTFVVHLGLSQAATVRAGAALGRHDLVALRQGAVAAIGLSVAISVTTITIYLSLPEFLVGLFVDPDDPDRPEILRIGVGLLVVAALFQMVDGLQVIALGLLRGLQDMRLPMLIAALTYWGLGLPTGYVLGFSLGWDGIGIWLGLVAGLAAAAVALLLRFRQQLRGLERSAAG